MPAAAMLEQIQPSGWSPTRLHCWALKDMVIFWAAATSILLKMPLNATAATILVAAAAFGGAHVRITEARGLTEQVAGPGSARGRGSLRLGRARDRPSLPRVGQYSLPSSAIRVYALKSPHFARSI